MILSRREFNQKSQDLVVCGITSNLLNTECSVKIEARDFAEGGIPKPSLVKANHVFTLDKGVVLQRFGRVRPEIVQRTKHELQMIL